MSSPSELESESDSIMLTLPREPDSSRSELCIVDHKELDVLFIDSGAPKRCEPFLRLGIAIGLPVMVGDESGDDSASVE